MPLKPIVGPDDVAEFMDHPKLIVGHEIHGFATEQLLMQYLIQNFVKLQDTGIRILTDDSILLHFRLGRLDAAVGRLPARAFFDQWDRMDYLKGYSGGETK